MESFSIRTVKRCRKREKKKKKNKIKGAGGGRLASSLRYSYIWVFRSTFSRHNEHACPMCAAVH